MYPKKKLNKAPVRPVMGSPRPSSGSSYPEAYDPLLEAATDYFIHGTESQDSGISDSSCDSGSSDSGCSCD